MPLPKPDASLVAAILSKRENRWDEPEDLFEPIRTSALQAIADGCITSDRAAKLVDALRASEQGRATFPNNALLRALESALQPGSWTTDAEHDLLVFIFCVYAQPDEIYSVPELALQLSLPLFGDIYPLVFDEPGEPIPLYLKISDFTGSFACGPRRKCFEIVAKAGGAASEGGRGTDYLFVAEKHVQSRVMSGAMVDAAARRLRFGVPRIYAERHFPVPAEAAAG